MIFILNQNDYFKTLMNRRILLINVATQLCQFLIFNPNFATIFDKLKHENHDKTL